MVERDTVNISINVRFILRAEDLKRVSSIGRTLCFGHKYCKFESCARLIIYNISLAIISSIMLLKFNLIFNAFF